MSGDSVAQVFGRGVLEVEGEPPVAVLGIHRDRRWSGQIRVRRLRAFAAPSVSSSSPRGRALGGPVDETTGAGTYFDVTWRVRGLESSDAAWISDLPVDDLPLPALEALIGVMADLETEGELPYSLEPDYEADYLYVHEDSRLRYEVRDLSRAGCLARAWREKGQWVLDEELGRSMEDLRPMNLVFAKDVISFIDDGLLLTPELVQFVTWGEDNEIEVDDAYFVVRRATMRTTTTSAVACSCRCRTMCRPS